MSARINLMDEPELPPPHEKLLRAPTFSEKYGWLKWFFVAIIVVAGIDYGIVKVLNANMSTNPYTHQKMVPPTAMTPGAAMHKATDPTQNWNVYANPTGKFKFKYPDGYTLTENAPQNNVQLASNQLPNGSNFLLTISFKPILGNATLETIVQQNSLCPKMLSQQPTQSLLNGQQPAQLYADTTCGKNQTSIIYTLNGDMLYIMTIETNRHFSEIKSAVDNILSTLTFWGQYDKKNWQNDQNKQVICSQEAKQCPNGGWVSRTGPNCEFAACPGTKNY